MKKIILIIFLFLSVNSLNASYLYGKNDKCIEDYYYKSGTFYFQYSKDNIWHSTVSNNYQKYIYDGFYYDSDNDICKPIPIVKELGLDYNQFNFLMGLLGLLFGLSLVTVFFYIPLRSR